MSAPHSVVPRSTATTPGEDGRAPDLATVRSLVAAGDRAAAAEALRAIEPDRCSGEHARELAALAEDCGEPATAVRFYNQHLSARPNDVAAMLGLARLRLDQGEYDRARSLLERALQLEPENLDAVLELGQLLEASGEIDEAVRLYQLAAEQSADERLDRAATAVQGPSPAPEADAGDDRADEPGAPPATVAAPADIHTVALSELFGGREGVYARQWSNEAGRTGYSPVREPFTPAVARRHLLGQFTVGIYPVRLDNTVNFLCIDLDLSREALQQALPAHQRLVDALSRVHHIAAQVQDSLAAVDIPSYLEDSGKKGRHVWVFFDAPLPAGVARRLGAAALATVQLPVDVTAECFPRQSRVATQSLGNLVKLPLGIHRGTGRRALFLDAAGARVPDQLGHLLAIRAVRAEIVARALDRLPPGGSDGGPERGQRGPGDGAAPGPTNEPRSEPGPGRPEDDGASFASQPRRAVMSDEAEREAAARAAPAPVEPPYRIEDDVEVQRVLAGCPVLARIVTGARSEHELSNEARVVLTHTLGCLSRGAAAVNAVLDEVPGLDPALRLASRLRGCPTSCARIRSHLGQLADELCRECAFDSMCASYPTPVLHAGTPACATRAETRRIELDRTVQEYYEVQAEISRAVRRRNKLEQRLRSLMSEQQLTEIRTSMGVLRAGDGDADGDGGGALSLTAEPLAAGEP